jgi:hypothetical protein
VHYRTIKKIEFLQSYLQKGYEEWYSIHPENITGFRIGKKNDKGHFCVIFHVAEKIELQKLKKGNLVPKYFEIKFPDGKVRRIKTDIEETGSSRFQFSICHKNLSNNAKAIGTVGVFVRDSNNNIYAITNYHVAAWNHMLNNKFEFNGNENNVFVDNTIQSNLILGLFSNEIDVAFVRIPNTSGLSNRFLSGNYIQSFALGPITPNAVGQDLKVYSRSNPLGSAGIMKSNSAVFSTGFRNILLKDVIMFDRILTIGGDSGSAVMAQDTLVGIIVGADEKYTYAIPYFKINSFLSLEII